MKTLKNIRDNVRMYVDEEVAADWTDAQIDAEINAAYLEVHAAVVTIFEDYYSSTYTFNVIENEQSYALPSNFFKLKRLELKLDTSSNKRYKANKMNSETYQGQLEGSNIGSTNNPTYEFNGENIFILPNPKENVINGGFLRYVATVDELVEDDDEVNIPLVNKNYKLIAKKAVSELLKKGQQDMTSAREFRNEFDIELLEMQAELEDRFLDGPKMIVDTEGTNTDFTERDIGFF